MKSIIDLQNLRWPFREDRLFSILAILILIVPLAFSFKTYENFEMIKLVLWLLLLGWALVEFFRSNGTLRVKGSRWLFLFLGSFLLWALLSTSFSADWLNSAFGFYYRFTSGLLFYATWALFLLLLLKVLDRERFIFITKILVFDALVIALWAFLNSLGIGYYGSLEPTGFERAPGLLGNPNFTAMFLVCVLPFAAVMGLFSEKFWGKIYYLIAALIMVLANVALASRGALLGLFVSLATGAVLLLWHRHRFKHFAVVTGIMALCLALGAIFVQVARPSVLKPVDYISDQNVSLRLLVWKASLQGMVQQPFLGVGPGNFQIFFERYRNEHLDSRVHIFDDAHNIFLQMGETTGVPFLLSFLGLLALATVAGLKAIKKNKDLLSLASLSGLAAFAVVGSFTPVSIPNFMLLGVLLAGLFLPEVREYALKIPKTAKALGLAAGAVLIIFGLSLVTAEYLFIYGYRSFFKEDYNRAYALTKAAQKINPTNSLYFTYRIGSEIKLDYSPELIEKHIRELKNMHKAQSRSPGVASNLYSLYYHHTGNKEYLHKAIENLQELLKHDDKTGSWYSQLGMYYYELGDSSSSKHYLNRGLEMRGYHLPSWLLLAKIYQQENDRPQALDILEKVCRQNPNDTRIRALWQYAKQEPDIKNVPIQFLIRQGVLE